MSAKTIVPQQNSIRKIFAKCEGDVNQLINDRVSSLVTLALEKKATKNEIAKALKYNRSLITRYFPQEVHE